MRDGWEIKPFGEVCEIVGGSQPPKKDFIFEPKEGYIRLIQVRDYRTSKYITYIPKEEAKRFCTKSDLMIGRYGPPIFGIFRGIEGAYNVALMKAIPNEKILDQDFFYWFLKTDKLVRFVEKTSKRAAGQDGVRKERLYTYPVPIPPLPEQRRIVANLNQAYTAIAKAKENAEQNLNNSKELFESYLQAVFENKGGGWEEKKLSEMCNTGAGGTPLKSHKDYYEGGNVPWLRSGEVNKKDIVECELYITENGLKNSSARLFPVNTVLIAMYGATAGQVGILRFECSTNQAVCGILPNKDFIPEFLYYKFIAGKQALVNQAVGGAQPNISQIKIKNTLIPSNSLKVQQSIVQKLDALSAETQKLDAIYQQKIEDLEELKKSILQKAFNGEI